MIFSKFNTCLCAISSENKLMFKTPAKIRFLRLNRKILPEIYDFISLAFFKCIIFKNMGVQIILEVNEARSRNCETSPRPLGPRCREIAIIVAVDSAIVGSCKAIRKKYEMVFLESLSSIS